MPQGVSQSIIWVRPSGAMMFMAQALADQLLVMWLAIPAYAWTSIDAAGNGFSMITGCLDTEQKVR